MGGRRAVRLAAALAALTALTVLTTLTEGLSAQALTRASVRSVAAGLHEAALEAVSCPRATLCIAVGRRARPHGQAPFAERWNGGSWTVQAIPAPKASDAYLVSVSCPSARDCTAVGGEASSSKQFGMLAEQWNGHRWRVTQASDPAGVKAGNLASVSCASVDNCVAVGMSQGRTRDLALSERWNGRSWKLLRTARVRSSAALTGVDCTRKGFCMAVGRVARSGQSRDTAMAQKLTKGAWQLVGVPVIAGSDLTVFYDTWCGNRSSCLAVGGETQGTSDTAIAANWTGSSWTAPQSLPGTANQALLGISCSSSARCMAVGSGVNRPVSQQWTGANWTPEATAPVSGASFASLYQVSCPTATRCIAVGARNSGALGAIGNPLAEEWDGTSWRILGTPNP
jgi:hypothetical protein